MALQVNVEPCAVQVAAFESLQGIQAASSARQILVLSTLFRKKEKKRTNRPSKQHATHPHTACSSFLLPRPIPTRIARRSNPLRRPNEGRDRFLRISFRLTRFSLLAQPMPPDVRTGRPLSPLRWKRLEGRCEGRLECDGVRERRAGCFGSYFSSLPPQRYGTDCLFLFVGISATSDTQSSAGSVREPQLEQSFRRCCFLRFFLFSHVVSCRAILSLHSPHLVEMSASQAYVVLSPAFAW